MTGGVNISTRKLNEEVRRLSREVSSKFTVEPSIEEIRSDLLIGLKRFANNVRRKYHAIQRAEESKKAGADQCANSGSFDGLGTGLRPTDGWTPDNTSLPSREVEAFLLETEKELLDHLEKSATNDTRKKHNISNKITSFLSNLNSRKDLVIVPTDKTNTVHLMKKDLYSNMVTMHLSKDAIQTDLENINRIHKEALALCESSKELLSQSEYNYIKSTVNKKAIPTVKLLLKDHKKKDANGDFPTRLVVPAKNYTAGFPHAGQRGIKAVLDKNKIDYTKKTIIQASDLKEKLELLGIRREAHSIISIDAKNMYPSVKFGQIKNAVNFFLKDASDADKEIARRCLGLTKFGMANTIVTFEDQFWIYGGDTPVEAKGLTIGGFESAFYANLVAAYILENSPELFSDSVFYGIYRDDGLNVIDGKKSTEELVKWLEKFQAKVNELTGSDCLQFTLDIWDPDSPEGEETGNENVSINRDPKFPYLDMELYWRESALEFRVHLKPNQQLKYLNRGSTHTSACFKAIPSGVIRRLTSLTSMTEENADKRINELYPEHAKALENAKLTTPEEYPTLRESLLLLQLQKQKKNDENPEDANTESNAARSKQERDKIRTTWFCISYSTIWGLPIHKRLKKLRDKYKLSWLRISMSYSRFSNLGQKMNSDLTGKIMEGIVDENLIDRACNCNVRSLLEDGSCMYDGECRKSMVIYELKCKSTGKSYIGKTQRHLKVRTREHIHDMWKVIESGRKNFGLTWWGSGGYARADAFAKYFGNLCRSCNNSNEVRRMMKKIMIPTILWQGDGIRCMKSSRTLQCKICMVERKEILSRFRADKNMIINDNSDIYSSCKCGSKFHRFSRTITTSLKTRMTQKKSKSTKKSKKNRPSWSHFKGTPKKNRRSGGDFPTPELESPCTPCSPAQLIDTNVPGLPYHTPSVNPTNLERAQYSQYCNSCTVDC